jgi:hypothetical protein
MEPAKFGGMNNRATTLRETAAPAGIGRTPADKQSELLVSPLSLFAQRTDGVDAGILYSIDISAFERNLHAATITDSSPFVNRPGSHSLQFVASQQRNSRLTIGFETGCGASKESGHGNRLPADLSPSEARNRVCADIFLMFSKLSLRRSRIGLANHDQPAKGKVKVTRRPQISRNCNSSLSMCLQESRVSGIRAALVANHIKILTRTRINL